MLSAFLSLALAALWLLAVCCLLCFFPFCWLSSCAGLSYSPARAQPCTHGHALPHTPHSAVYIDMHGCGAVSYSATGTRARVARVRAEYPNQLDYSGAISPHPKCQFGKNTPPLVPSWPVLAPSPLAVPSLPAWPRCSPWPLVTLLLWQVCASFGARLTCPGSPGPCLSAPGILPVPWPVLWAPGPLGDALPVGHDSCLSPPGPVHLSGPLLASPTCLAQGLLGCITKVLLQLPFLSASAPAFGTHWPSTPVVLGQSWPGL